MSTALICWLHVRPDPVTGLKLCHYPVSATRWTTPRSVLPPGLRLGAPIVHPHVCVCGKTVTVDGLVASVPDATHVTTKSTDVICRAFIKSVTLATREPHSLCTGSGKRPDGVTQIPWSRGRCSAWDTTCPNTFVESHVQASSTRAGLAAEAAEASNARKYADITTAVDFIPVAIETSGTWGEQGFDLIRKIGRRIAELTYEPRATSFLRQRLSVAVQRGNAVCVMGIFRSTNTVATEL